MYFLRAPSLAISVVTALALLMGCGAPAATPTVTLPTARTSQPRAIVIDTDMATDDWMAILYLFQRLDVTVRAITVTGAGEAHCAPGIRHALGLAALSGYDKMPVACGRETPLQGSHAFPDSWREDVDNLLGLTLPKGQDSASNLTAVELLASVIQSSPGKVTLLTLGPLTNVAQTLQKTPSLVDNIDMIYIMGGAVNVHGNVGASGVGINNNAAEWNIYVDPYAANVVLQSSAPITLVPLDATNHAPVTSKFYKRLASSHTTPEATFVFDVLTQMQGLIDSGGYYFWDSLAAAILTDESLATLQNQALCVVETDGPESGRTKAGEGCPKVRVAISADAGRFEQMFLDILNRAGDASLRGIRRGLDLGAPGRCRRQPGCMDRPAGFRAPDGPGPGRRFDPRFLAADAERHAPGRNRSPVEPCVWIAGCSRGLAATQAICRVTQHERNHLYRRHGQRSFSPSIQLRAGFAQSLL